MERERSRYLIAAGIVLAAVAAYAIWQLWSLRWVTDDAFISFRYAENLSRNLGLVFNAGERVEGYTNFLWTLLLAAGNRVGLDPVSFSAVLGVAAYLLTAACWTWISWDLHRREPSRPFLPLAALALLVQHDQHIFATCGLETSWVSLFVTLGFAALLLGERARDHYLAGAALTVAALTRPDALIFLAAAVAFTLLSPGDRVKSAARLLALPVIVYVPYWIWRYSYYGYPFPNTYYAKSGGLAYYEQGLKYLWMYVKTYYVFALVPVAIASLWIKLRRPGWGKARSSESRTAWLLVAFLVPYTMYVARVGGDFMFGRFLLPVAGFGFFALERALCRVRVRTVFTSMAALLLVVLVWARQDLFKSALIVNGVADEPACYPTAWHARARSIGEQLRPLFANHDVRVAFTGRYAMYVYYSQPAMAIETETGLTDTEIAHQPLVQRGRPGHEKHARQEYLQSRGVQFLFRPPIESNHPLDRLRVVQLGDLEAFMVTYDAGLMESWAGDPRVTFVNFPRYLDELLADSLTVPRPDYREFLQFSRGYYFDHHNDPERLLALERLASR